MPVFLVISYKMAGITLPLLHLPKLWWLWHNSAYITYTWHILLLTWHNNLHICIYFTVFWGVGGASKEGRIDADCKTKKEHEIKEKEIDCHIRKTEKRMTVETSLFPFTTKQSNNTQPVVHNQLSLLKVCWAWGENCFKMCSSEQWRWMR